MKELATIQSKLNAPKNLYNSFGGYAFRSAESILESLKPLLAETGCTLTISDTIELIGSDYYIKATATLKNSAGESESTSAYAREERVKKGMDAAQITGSASSYARKYALNGLFAIDDNKDPDATNNGKDGKQVKTDTAPNAQQEAISKIKSTSSEAELLDLWTTYSHINPSLTMEGTEFYKEWIKRRGEVRK